MTPEAAQTIALQVLGHIVGDQDQLDRFVSATGFDGATMRARAGDPVFLGGVLDHLLAEESLLIEFCEDAGLRPESIGRARMALPGAAPDW